MDIKNKRLLAANSHFVSQRDKIVAELDSLLNSYSGPLNMDAIIQSFEKLAITNMALSNINSIIEDNSDANAPVNGINLNELEEMNMMVEAIRQKLNIGDQNLENINKNEDAKDNSNNI